MRRNRLLQLLADNRRSFTPIQSRIVMADGGSEATVYLYDPIVADRATAEWWGGVCPQDFAPAFRAIEADTIHLRVNCPGGDVFGAEAMCQSLRDQAGHVIAHIEGVSASAATMVCCAADEVHITPNSKYMIHQAWTIAWGNASDLRSVIELLDKCDATMYQEYQRKTGNDLARITDWCKAETWFTGAEAVDAGFADKLIETSAKAQALAGGPSAQWKLRAYAQAPTDLDEPSQTPAPAPAASDEHRDRQRQRVQLLGRTAIV